MIDLEQQLCYRWSARRLRSLAPDEPSRAQAGGGAPGKSGYASEYWTCVRLTSSMSGEAIHERGRWHS